MSASNSSFPSSSSSSSCLSALQSPQHHRQQPVSFSSPYTRNLCESTASSSSTLSSQSTSPTSSASSPMAELFVSPEDSALFPHTGSSAQTDAHDLATAVLVPTMDKWKDMSNSSSHFGGSKDMGSGSNNDRGSNSDAVHLSSISGLSIDTSVRLSSKVIQGCKPLQSPPPGQSMPLRSGPHMNHTPSPPAAASLSTGPLHLSSPRKPYLAFSLSDANPQDPTPSRRISVSDSFCSSLMAKKQDTSMASNISIGQHASAGMTETTSDVMDIESCIDNPILAPLGRHVNKRRSPKRFDKGHIDINVVRPTSPARFIQEQERDSHAPVTSLILRRRRLDCAQLDHYLQNLQPTLDPHTMCTLQSPLFHLSELDLSRNRLSALPENMISLVPFLSYLNLSHNQFTEIPLDLCRLTRLQVLIMSQNRIEGPVPHQICSSLTLLKTLRLCANQITALPQTLACLDKLESLSMGSVYGGNLLTTFPSNCIGHMSALRELDLSHNKLCFLPPDTGHPRSHLRQLVASDNKLEAIPKSIGMCRELRSLNLGRNQLTSLPTEIADLKQLDTLDLSENLLCVIPGDVADFLTKTTLLLTGNPFTRGYCDASRNPVSEIGGLGVTSHMPPSDEERYAAMLKSLSRRAILNSAASSSSSAANTASMASFGGGSGRDSPRLSAAGPPSSSATAASDNNYEMDQDERLDYHLYYTRHALTSRPPSRAESVSGLSEYGGAGSDYGSSYGGSWNDPYGVAGAGSSTPRVNVEAVLSDIDSFFEYIPPLASSSSISTMMTTTISPSTAMAEPSIFDGTSLSAPHSLAESLALTSTSTLQTLSPPSGQVVDTMNSTAVEPVGTPLALPPVGVRPATTSTPSFFPSLKELAARAVLHSGDPLPLECIPEAVVDYLQPGARPCGLCRRPYVKEWVSSVRVKSYLGHPAVARRVRFCSAACWKAASEQLELEEKTGVATSPSAPGATTGHLPPVVVTADAASASSALDESLIQSGMCTALPSPTTPLTPSSREQQPAWAQGMRTCKGGQTYWPVIGQQRRGRMLVGERSIVLPSSLTFPGSAQGSVASGSIVKTNVCSGGCLGGGVCEW